jgi:hypothetical protein
MNTSKFLMLILTITIVWLLLVYGVTKWYEPDEETPSTSSQDLFKFKEG